jgi:MOSC domain-containing protein YiiM
MRVLSVNVGMPKTVVINGQEMQTGIFKSPVNGRVMLRQHNLDGDKQADPDNHGGEEKAAYLYPYENYVYWRDKLQRHDLHYGQFGENLTTEGLLEHAIYPGDVYRIGEAVVQTTTARIPCSKLAHKMDIPDFVAQFQQAGLPGVYLRVVEEGSIGAGDAITKLEDGDITFSIQALYRMFFNWREHTNDIKKALERPSLHPWWRKKFTQFVDRAQ